MDKKIFEEHLLLYGADFARWPELLRQQAEQALSGDESLRQMLSEAQAFEQQAKERPVLKDDAAFAERIILAAEKSQPRKASGWLAALGDIMEALPFPNPAYALATAAIAGFALGIFSQAEVNSSSSASLDTMLYEVRSMI